MPTVLVSPGPLRNQTGPFREILKSAGFDCIDPAGDHTLTEAELREFLPRADAIHAFAPWRTSATGVSGTTSIRSVCGNERS